MTVSVSLRWFTLRWFTPGEYIPVSETIPGDEFWVFDDNMPSPPAHVWCAGPLTQCALCGEFEGLFDGFCDPSKIADKVEACCECGEDYPRSDLIAGHVFCAECRLEDLVRRKKTSTKFDRVRCMDCGSKKVLQFMRAYISPLDTMECGDCGSVFNAADVDELWR
jgi:ribosomal protein S27E